jgi:hypothetical protein
MGVGNQGGGGNSGNKRSNHNFEHRELQILGEQLAALVGLATESTLQQVLMAIQDGQDFEAKIVVDDDGNGATYLEVRIWNPDTQSWEAPLYYLPGSNTGVPAGSLTAPIIYINNGAILSQIYIELLAQGLTLDDIETNTDDVSTETTLAALLLAFNNEDFSTETTLAALLLAFNNEDFATETTLSGIKTQIDLLNFISTALEVTVTSSVLPTGAATETTLLATNSLLTIMDAVLDSILTDTNAMVVDLAAIEILITNTNALLTTIDGVLDAIKLDTANLDVALSTRATEATQLLVNANLDLLNSKFNTLGQKVSAASHPVVLSTEQEAILEAIKLAVQNLDMDVDGLATEVTLAALLLAFNTEDFATETTLALLAATDFATETTLASLLTAFNTEDFASQVTLQALLTAFNTVDFSTEVTLNALLTAFNAEDFATETTLASVLVDTTSIDTRLTPQTRTQVYTVAVTVGIVPPGSLAGSVFNSGSAAGIWNGSTLPAGVSVPWSPIGNRDTYGAINYNATGTTFIIEYTI